MLFFEGGPVFALSVCFLDGDNIVVVEEFLYCFLGLPADFREAFSGEEAISVPCGERKRSSVIREDSVRFLFARWGGFRWSMAGGSFWWMRGAVGSFRREIVNGVLV